MRGWRSWNLYWFDRFKSHQVMFVNFDNLKTDLISTLKEILFFLGLALPQDKINCILQSQEGMFHRKNHSDQEKYFSAWQKSQLEMLRNEVFKKIGFI